MPLVLIAGPSNAGAGEREQMLVLAASRFTERGVSPDQIVRVDVPGRGVGEGGEGTIRSELEPVVPLLQSGSLFGDTQGLLMVDADNLQKAEVDLLVDLLGQADLNSLEMVLVATGTVPKSLAALGETVAVKKMWEREAAQWLDTELRQRRIELAVDAKTAFLMRFGTDTAAMGRALDQLAEGEEALDATAIIDRFRNRPDEPTWHITDAIERGDVATALRRLSDFLTHEHPLVYLAALETDLRKRALAAAAPDQETLRKWVTGSDRQLSRLWSQRGKVRESSLRRAQEALVRADRVVKTEPEQIHRVTLERLTVALCRWYG